MEILFPVEDETLKKEVLHVLEAQLKDNLKAHLLQKDGTYQKVDRRGKEPYSYQEAFCGEAVAAAQVKDVTVSKRVFIPETHIPS